jgi:exonuclease III
MVTINKGATASLTLECGHDIGCNACTPPRAGLEPVSALSPAASSIGTALGPPNPVTPLPNVARIENLTDGGGEAALTSITPAATDQSATLEQNLEPLVSADADADQDHIEGWKHVLPKSIRFVFFGPNACITSRHAFLMVVRDSNVLQGCQFSRQRNGANGVPFLVLTVRRSEHVEIIRLMGMTPFVQSVNATLNAANCRVTIVDRLPWMAFAPNDARNTECEARNTANVAVVLKNGFSVLDEGTTPISGIEIGTGSSRPSSITLHRRERAPRNHIRGKFRAGSLNVRGLKICSQVEKASDIAAVLTAKQIDICAIQETWLDPMTEDVIAPAYTFVGTVGYETATRLGGGTGFLIRDDFMSAVEVLHWKTKKFTQATWIKVKSGSRRNHLIMASVYVRPVNELRTLAEVGADLDLLAGDILKWSQKFTVLINGDFNARIGKADDGKVAFVPKYGEKTRNAEGNALIELMTQCDLFSLGNRHGPTTEYTCIRANGNSVVDYLLGSKSLLKCSKSVTHHPVDDDSDHVLMAIDIPSNIKPRATKPATTIRWRLDRLEDPTVESAYKDAIVTAIVSLGHQPGDAADASQAAIDQAAKSVSDIIIGAANCTIGKKLSKGRNTVPWWCSEYNDIRVLSQQHYETAMRSKNTADWDTFVTTRKKKNKTKGTLVKTQFQKDLRGTSSIWESGFGSKAAWTAAKRLRNSKAGCSSPAATKCHGITDETGEYVCEPEGIARVFRTHYSKLATPSTSPNYDEAHRVHVEEEVRKWANEGTQEWQPEYDAEFLAGELDEVIKAMPRHKSADAEDMTGELIKYGGNALHSLILAMINRCWLSERTPNSWGQGVIVNLFKDGNPNDPGNYRGITLIPVIRKLFSNMLRKRIEKGVTLHESQAAFREGRSCVDHIYTLSQIVNASGMSKQQLFVLFLDIKKAYDTVWRAGLFYKLKAKGVKGRAWRVLYDLFGKTQSKVRVCGTLSSPFDLLVGVGQGDPLSTLLFDIFIDDLLESLHTECGGNGVTLSDLLQIAALAFADDVACLSHDAAKFQASIDHVGAWLRKWRMDANTVKSKVVVFHPHAGHAAHDPSPHTFTLAGAPLTQVSDIKYLGVWFSENGSWDKHVATSLAKMKKSLGFWRPLLGCHGVQTKVRLMMLYTFIYSTALYGSEVWNATKARLGAFDVVVKSAIRCVMGLRRNEVGSDALLMDTGLIPPSVVLMANKLCYQRHLLSLDPTRWCAIAQTCKFAGVRTAGRPRAGANWGGEVRNFTAVVSHDLNVGDLFRTANDQNLTRRVSTRSARAVVDGGLQHDSEEVNSEESPSRKVLLDNLWLWSKRSLATKYESMAACMPAWYYGCVSAQARGASQYLRTLSSKRARVIMSARSGRLVYLQARLKSTTWGMVDPVGSDCTSCQELLGDLKQATSHCMVDCPAVWPRLDVFFSTVQGLFDLGGSFSDYLQTLSGVDLIMAILSPNKVDIPLKVTGRYWAAVADLYCCQGDCDCRKSHGVADLGASGRAIDGTHGVGVSDSDTLRDSQDVLGVVNVHVDTAVM